MTAWARYAGWGVALGGAALLGFGLLWRSGQAGARLPVLVVGDSVAEGTAEALAELRPGRVTTAARSGMGVEELARILPGALARAPAARSVVISVGTNSLGTPTETLLREITELVGEVRAASRQAVILGPPPVAGSDLPQAAKDAALSLNVALGGTLDGFVNLWTVVGDPARGGHYRVGLGAPDGIHPTREGYYSIAHAILAGT